MNYLQLVKTKNNEEGLAIKIPVLLGLSSIMLILRDVHGWPGYCFLMCVSLLVY